MTARKYGVIVAGMALSRRDVTDFAVTMKVVVPMHELPHPFAGGFQVWEAGSRECGMIFAGTEQGLGVGVIVRDTGAAVRGRDA